VVLLTAQGSPLGVLVDDNEMIPDLQTALLPGSPQLLYLGDGALYSAFAELTSVAFFLPFCGFAETGRSIANGRSVILR